MKINYFDNKGAKVDGGFSLSSSLTVDEPNEGLISMYVYMFLANARSADAKSKGRGEVSGGGKKPWKQKGTGRARHGSTRSPIWKGGGVSFGPKGDQNYKKKMTKKMKLNAFKSVITLKAKEDKLSVLKDASFKSTKEALSLFKNVFDKFDNVLLVQTNDQKEYKYYRNIDGIKVVRTGELNTYDLATSKDILFFEGAVKELESKIK